jgi:hypothetical protein
LAEGGHLLGVGTPSASGGMLFPTLTVDLYETGASGVGVVAPFDHEIVGGGGRPKWGLGVEFAKTGVGATCPNLSAMSPVGGCTPHAAMKVLSREGLRNNRCFWDRSHRGIARTEGGTFHRRRQSRRKGFGQVGCEGLRSQAPLRCLSELHGQS